jgi:uncharacterized membrane protein
VAGTLENVQRSVPGLLRLTVLVGLGGFWLGVGLVVAVLADWPADVVAVLGIVLAGALVTVLGLVWQVRSRTHGARPMAERAAQGRRARNVA